MDQHSGSATLPRGFRFEIPRTPEPFAEKDEAQIPSPPRPRLRLVKRRVVSQLTAPTQQFLASVAAADVPIPSIEEPETSSHDFAMGNVDSFPARVLHEEMDAGFLQPVGRTYELPKTPVPDFIPCLSPAQYPNWTISSTASSVESTPEPDYESSRPSTARSTLTSASLFSRFSMLSDDDNCASLVLESKEHYHQESELPAIQQSAAGKGKARKAPWTKAMSDHLWSTFILYLQDPKVTPFRMGKSCLPPHGVCLRVAREAKRSWKGAKALTKAINVSDGKKSGSTTPTAENSNTFIQWPHTCAATRVHLRELCRQKAAAGAKNPRFLPRSTTPFEQAAARHWNKRSTTAQEPVPFATQDMSLSLALSTAESMQPTGPLAQLTGSTPEPAEEEQSNATEPFPLAPAFDMPIISPALETFEGEPSFAERRRLGSPFGANSYGPSSSGSLATVLGLSGPMPRRQSQTLGSRRTLQSPVRMSRSGTQKRRHTQSSVPRVRPSIGADLWLDPNFSMNSTGDARADREFSSTTSNHYDELFIPRIPPVPTLSSSTSMPNVGGQLLEPPALQPPRLGSPFKGHRATRSSFSFPSRMHRAQSGSVDLGMLGRPFATIQQPSTESNTSPVRSNLAGRLAYLDQRLKEIRQREANRRSQSPL
ncbi:hypothetical protein QBC36DRAFT_47515 [Triangularia setosa]|uniref:Uncharacterized protein n=1 Tax=Triangularia setosa TaxID=2587417 RepID=A0AAN6W4E3_9PEZI|nr:hypothetical protein QBC36DRAFT_47515 [Podospora setosa]